jgi:hypothetical protein
MLRYCLGLGAFSVNKPGGMPAMLCYSEDEEYFDEDLF